MSMTIQQAIENRERCYKYLLGCGPKATPENVEAVRLSLEALQEKAEREDPKPLTIEELHGMIGEPVWVQGPGIPEYGRWAIVEDVVENSLILVNDFTCHGIGETWEAYRHKPKED